VKKAVYLSVHKFYTNWLLKYMKFTGSSKLKIIRRGNNYGNKQNNRAGQKGV